MKQSCANCRPISSSFGIARSAWHHRDNSVEHTITTLAVEFCDELIQFSEML
jgi:hypothetical protein